MTLTSSGAVVYESGKTGSSSPHVPLSIGAPAEIGEEMEWELACIGSRLLAKRDGTPVGALELSRISAPKHISVQGGEITITAVDLIDLDGLSEAEALKILEGAGGR